MNFLRPKDGDYIVRGIFLLLIWVCIGWVPFAVLGGILAGAGGATLATLSALFITPFLYGRYLKLDPKAYPQKVKICECGHGKNMHQSIQNYNDCLSGRISSTIYDLRQQRYRTTIEGGCKCRKFRRQFWWRTNSQNPHDWSV